MLKTLILVAVIAAVAPACATKGFVRTEAGVVDQRVDTLTATVDEIQARDTGNPGTDRRGRRSRGCSG